MYRKREYHSDQLNYVILQAKKLEIPNIEHIILSTKK